MPVFEGRVSDEQIRAIIAFIKSRWPAEIRAKQRKIDEGYRRGLEAANPTRR
jgi:mono/diheme cytochrome c family protein